MKRKTTSPVKTAAKHATASEAKSHLELCCQLAEMDMFSQLLPGRKNYFAKGFAEGKAKAQVEVARRMLRMKRPLSYIAIVCDLSEAEVKRLAAKKKR